MDRVRVRKSEGATKIISQIDHKNLAKMEHVSAQTRPSGQNHRQTDRQKGETPVFSMFPTMCFAGDI